jgi:hypothetical protein
MTLIIFAVIVICIVALIVWGITSYLPVPTVPKNLLAFVVILFGALAIAQRAGVF